MQETDVSRNEKRNSLCGLKIKIGGTERQVTEKTIHKCVSKRCGAEKEDDKERGRTIRSQINYCLYVKKKKGPNV